MGRIKNTKTKNFEMAVNKADYDKIVDLAAQHRSKRHNFSFCDELKSIEEGELNKLLEQLLKILMEYLEKNFQSTTVDWTILNPEQCKMIGQFIQATTDIGLAFIQCELTTLCQIKLVQIAVFLHGIMLPMPDNMDNVKNCIAHYCEKLFLTGVIDKCELFLGNVILYLVRKTLAKKAAKNDVKRIYGIRKILKTVMQQNGPNTVQLWPLFSECAVSQTYLSFLEGQKLIALVMTLDPDRLMEIHTKIKSLIPGVSIKTAAAYGRVYFEAWCYSVKFNDLNMKTTIELTCLQTFLVMGIESQYKNILPIVRKIFNDFFIHKKEKEVSRMFHDVYQPIIYRYLKNPSGLKRAAAAQLFLDIFPLEDTTITSVVATESEINEQLLMIKELLTDDFPIVRITTILGICVSMSVNWEVFPEEMLKTFFRTMVNRLSRDSACAEVRVAVVKGLKCLLENPLTVQCLINVLPKLTGLFHDVSDDVRIAFCQLLLRVKKISAIKYFDIVPINHLFARMEEDCYAVKKCLSNLLHNSYFPKNQDPKVWLGRCLEIIKTERVASRIFFTFVSGFIGVDLSVKFMIQATKAVHFYVKTKSTSSYQDMEISDKENIQSFTEYINTLEQAVGFGNLNIVSTLMEAIAIMWLSLKPKSDLNLMKQPGEDKKLMKMLVTKLSSSLQELCIYYKDTEAWEPVFFLSSFLPCTAVASLSSLCFVRVRSLPPTAQEYDYMTLLECLANQFQMKELLRTLKEWIEAGLSSSYLPPPAKKRRGRKSSERVHQDQIKPHLANRMLNSLLNHKNLQSRTLKEEGALLEITHFISDIERKLERVNARLMSETEADFLNLLIYNIARISVHLHNYPNYDQPISVPFLNEFVEWTNKNLLKHLSPVEKEKGHFELLIFKICENLCKILGDVISLGFIEPDNCLYLDFICSLLGTGVGHRFFIIASRFLFKHAASSQYIILLDNNTLMLEYHFRYLNKVFVLMNDEAMLEKISETEREEVALTLGNVMQIIHNYVGCLTELSSETFKTILKIIVDILAVESKEIVEDMAEAPFCKLPFSKAANFFWSIITQKPKLIRTYIKYLIEMFKDSQNMSVSHWIAYWMLSWRFLNAKSISRVVANEIKNLVLHLEKFMHDLYPRTKDSEQNNCQDNAPPVPLQLFQHHCHGELIKLKNRVQTKLGVK